MSQRTSKKDKKHSNSWHWKVSKRNRKEEISKHLKKRISEYYDVPESELKEE